MAPDVKIFRGDSRSMHELQDGSVHLVVTSPPYWHIKDYGIREQTGFGQTLHEYLGELYHVWKECFRVLLPGRRLCVNIGDQFARARVYGRYKVIPLHAEVIAQCEDIGFDFLGSIIWQKKTTMRTSGGATIMGSYPHPPSGIVEIDYEHILLFKKPGRSRKVSPEIKERSKLSKEEWKLYFQGHWKIGGARQVGHQAKFPEELPLRLIRMFSFIGETVLDPFLGSGTTAKVAIDLERSAVGYEINEDFIPTIERTLATAGTDRSIRPKVRVHDRRDAATLSSDTDYSPRIKDASPIADPGAGMDDPVMYKVVGIRSDHTVELEGSRSVRLLGIRIREEKRAMEYLKDMVKGKKVFLRDSEGEDITMDEGTGPEEAYIYLKNRIFINTHMIKDGMAVVDPSKEHIKKPKFRKLENG